MENFYIYSDGLVQGPFSREKLDRLHASGVVAPETLVCAAPDAPWQPFRTLPATEPPPAEQRERESAAGKVRFSCPHCGQPYLGDTNRLGREMPCRKCGKPFTPTIISADSRTDAASHTDDPPTFSAHEEDTPSFAAAEIPEGDILCPHCYRRFDSEYLLYIAQHPTLTGDPVLGPGAGKRFAPTAFNAMGLALDAAGTPCAEMACPRCHLPIPASVIEEPSYCCSIVGAPSSGKTYFLTALLHRLRHVLPAQFDTSLLDADPRLNAMLNGYENAVFRAPHPDKVAILLKTELQGAAFFDTVFLNGIPVQLPKPFVFEMRKQHDRKHGVNLIFYDNAGEHFQPGEDKLENPGTRHLGCSDGILFLFDPLNDAVMRTVCGDDPQLETDEHVCDQTILLTEMIGRIRRHRNLNAADRCETPLVVAVGKFDAWKNIFEKDPEKLTPVRENPDVITGELDCNLLLDVSFALRELLLGYVPELVQTAESFFTDVIFMPVSSFGVPARRSESGQFGVLPEELSPVWAEMPLLYLMSRAGLIPRAAPETASGTALGQVMDGFIVFPHPRDGRRVRLPGNYRGAVLDIDGRRYRLPPGATGEGGELWS